MCLTENQHQIGSTFLLFPVSTVAPGDEIVGLIRLSLQPGWHIYWKNPGEAGFAPSFTWELPEGISLKSEPVWPAPTLFTQSGSPFYGYDGSVDWIIHLCFKDDMAPGSYTVNLQAFYLACDDMCVPFTSKVDSTFTVDLSLPKGSLHNIPENALPKIPVEIASKAALLKNSTLSLSLLLSEEKTALIKEVILFPETQHLFPVRTLPTWKRGEDSLQIETPLSAEGKQKIEASHSFSGLIQLVFKDRADTYSVQTTVEAPRAAPIIEEDTSSWKQADTSLEKNFSSLPLSMSAILLAAFIGGLLLNFTPCVLPVVGIKILHLISFKGEKQIFLHGLSFTFGVLLTFWTLAGSIYFLEHVGSSTLGWGFQLQQPLFVASLILALFIFSMNLFGLFELGSSLSSWAAEVEGSFRQKRPSLLVSFLSGLLATVVATPCTGPLLGSVLGFAATFDPKDGFYLFTAIGLGMAFPFLFITLFPVFIKILPRPGLWMIGLKQFFGFCMLGTIVWLLWVLESEVQSLSLILIFMSFFMLSLSLWIYGKWGSLLHVLPVRIIANIISLLFLVCGTVFLFLSFDSPAKECIEKALPQYQSITWKPYSKEALSHELELGKVVFVSFSAKWCLTCQANKLIFLAPGVAESFKQHGIVAMEADWTNGDEEITETLRSLGRNGVPVYAIFRHDKEPVLLQEILSPDVVIQAISSVSTES